jgi:hypothetical protein
LVIPGPDIIAFTISGITDIIAISDISTSTIGRSKKCKKCTQTNKKKHTKSKINAHQKSSLLKKKFQKKCTQNTKKCKKHTEIEIQKTEKKNTKKCKKHTEIAKITPKMPKMIYRG